MPQREFFDKYLVRNVGYPDVRARLLRDYSNGAPLTGVNGLRRQLAAIDLEYFGRAYLPHYFVRESPDFHGELDAIWRDGVMKGLNPTTDANVGGHKSSLRALPAFVPAPLMSCITS